MSSLLPAEVTSVSPRGLLVSCQAHVSGMLGSSYSGVTLLVSPLVSLQGMEIDTGWLSENREVQLLVFLLRNVKGPVDAV